MLLDLVAIAVLIGCALLLVVMALAGLFVFAALLALVASVSLAVGWYVMRRTPAARQRCGPGFAVSP